jgi:hypothetical protein
MADLRDEYEDVDYMHPFGKPEESKNKPDLKGDDAKPDAKRMRYALDEADGHSIKKPDPFLDE